MLTLAELLRDIDLGLLAGGAHADAPVRWVHISELLDPTPWLSGGELLLTTGMQLESAKRQREFVARLADHQLAGLGVGTGFAHAEVPPPLLKAAAERDFPVFEVPYDVPFIALTEKAFTRLVNEQYAVLQRSIAAHERLERIVLAERGLDAVVAALSTLIGGAAMVFDPRGEPLVSRAFRKPIGDGVLTSLSLELRSRGRAGQRRGFVPSDPALGDGAIALPIAAGGVPAPNGNPPQAWLVAAKDGGGLTEFDRLTLHQAVTIVALELLRRRIAEETERRLAGDVLSELVAGQVAGRELARRLEPFGIGERTIAIVLAPGPTRAAAVEAALGVAVRDEVDAGLVAAHGPLVCALLPAGEEGEEELFALAERVTERLPAGADDEPLRAGAGRAVPAPEARRSYHEARCALEASGFASAGNGADGNGAARGGNGDARGDARPGRVATYRDLGSFQLLLSLQDDDALRLFCDSILGPIETSEGHYGDELMRSLEAFIECNGQWERAAQRLYCHRHTLRYRIRKVEELTGRDLANARDRIEFWLALRGRELAR
jgi:purine catabolism regulatory family protein/PucR-like helix-turn-helix protein/diguanylate cyclase with GGDEF domain